MGKLPFIKDAPETPDVEDGDILKATITAMEREEGKYGEQMRFDFKLENGFPGKAWISFYEVPTERTKLGKLLMKLNDKTGVDYQSVEEGLKGLKDYGQIFVKVNGFREWEDLTLPKFTVVADKLPPKEMAQKPLAEKTEKTPKMSLEEAKKLVAALPEEAQKDYLNYLRDTGQLKENL